MVARSFLRKAVVPIVLMLSLLVATGCGDSGSPDQDGAAQVQQGAAAQEGQQQEGKQQPADLVQQVLAIIGTASDDQDTGAVSAKLKDEGRVELDYRFNPVGITDVDREIGVGLSSRLRRAFEEHPNLQAITVTVYLPFQDAYGNTSWQKYVTFTFDRELYGKINWADFLPQNLLTVAKDVTVHRDVQDE